MPLGFSAVLPPFHIPLRCCLSPLLSAQSLMHHARQRSPSFVQTVNMCECASCQRMIQLYSSLPSLSAAGYRTQVTADRLLATGIPSWRWRKREEESGFFKRWPTWKGDWFTVSDHPIIQPFSPVVLGLSLKITEIPHKNYSCCLMIKCLAIVLIPPKIYCK